MAMMPLFASNTIRQKSCTIDGTGACVMMNAFGDFHPPT